MITQCNEYTYTCIYLCYGSCSSIAAKFIVHTHNIFSLNSLKRQYPPLSLLKLQRMIDLGCVDPNEVIDITSICMTGHYNLNVHQRHYGVNLTEDVCILIYFKDLMFFSNQ